MRAARVPISLDRRRGRIGAIRAISLHPRYLRIRDPWSFPPSAAAIPTEALGYLKTLDVGNTDTVQIFYPGLAVGQVDRLLGYPIFINNDLTALTSSLPVAATKHIYFGDFSKYVIRKIRDISISRNDFLYWAEGEVGFMGWLRLDGNLINQNAIKALKQHA